MPTYEQKIEMIKNGSIPEDLAKDPDWEIRLLVAYKEQYLDILMYDDEQLVRAEVAQHGYQLNHFVYDHSPYVRLIVARQGFGLDILSNDTVDIVRNIANSLLNSKSYKIANEVLDSPLYLHIAKDKYTIIWGYFIAESIDVLYEELKRRKELEEKDDEENRTLLDTKDIEKYKTVIEDLIKYSKLDREYAIQTKC